MNEYDLYVPLRSNDGKRMAPAKLARLKKRLIKQFAGLTYFPQKNKGIWKLGAVTFRDEIVILRVLSPNTKKVQKFWQKLKTELQREWQQQEILIVYRKIKII